MTLLHRLYDNLSQLWRSPMWICPYCGAGVYDSIIEHLYGGRDRKGCAKYWETVPDVKRIR
jgi:hypothetical protein